MDWARGIKSLAPGVPLPVSAGVLWPRAPAAACPTQVLSTASARPIDFFSWPSKGPPSLSAHLVITQGHIAPSLESLGNSLAPGQGLTLPPTAVQP